MISYHATHTPPAESRTTSPTVSVVVPNYNYAHYLDRRMDSILKQTFQDFEIIILDDCSTDNSAEVIEKYSAHQKVSRIQVNKVNSGSPFMQWKVGIEMARGKYVWIAEADDEAMPDFLEITVAAMEANHDAAIAFTGSWIIDENSDLTDADFDKWPLKPSVGHKINVYDGKDYIIHNLYWENYIYNASMTLFRRTCYSPALLDKSVGMRNAGDWLFWVNLATTGRVMKIHRKLNLYRKHSNSITAIGNKNGNSHHEELLVIKYIEQHFSVGRYRKSLRHGHFIKCIRRNKSLSPMMRSSIYHDMHTILGATQKAYVIERINRVLSHVCPLLLTKIRDRL
jgi:glycosyltransferase involved in cell wall biosynthesis